MPSGPLTKVYHVLNIPEKEQAFIQEELGKVVQGQILAKVGRGLSHLSPDILVMGLGFYLGYVMNMPAGIGPVQFPNFSTRVTQLLAEVKGQEAHVETLQRALPSIVPLDTSECQADCNEKGRMLGPSFDVAACIEDCLGHDPVVAAENILQKAIAKLESLKADLRKHRIAQGAIMAILFEILARQLGGIIPF